MNKEAAFERLEAIEKETKELRAIIDKPDKYVPKGGAKYFNGNFKLNTCSGYDSYSKVGMTGSKEELESRRKGLKFYALCHNFICDEGGLNAGDFYVDISSRSFYAYRTDSDFYPLIIKTSKAVAEKLAAALNNNEIDYE